MFVPPGNLPATRERNSAPRPIRQEVSFTACEKLRRVMTGLGLNHGEVNSSAALLRDGVILAAACEERFNRRKKCKDFPGRATRYCLDQAGLQLGDCDFVAQAWNPGAAWCKYNPLMSETRVRREDYFYSVPDHLYGLVPRDPGDWVRQSFDGGLPPTYYVQHHRTHAATAYYLSPFEEAAILTADWKGELECTTFSHGQGNRVRLLGTQSMPHSLGMFYATYTELLGYRPDEDEWKVMALSAYPVEHADLLERIRSTYRLLPQGRLELDQRYYQGALIDQPRLYTPSLVELLGGQVLATGAEPGEWAWSVAVAMQLASEEIALHYLQHLHRLAPTPNLALGGGYFMNCVFNGKVTRRSPFENVYVSFAPADLGNSLGAALYVAHEIHQEPRRLSYTTSYLGPAFEDSEIEAALLRRGIAHQRLADPPRKAAELLAQGEVVAFFQGRMEFGERALGNRSILADPRDPTAKDRINSMIKYRESFRPFAPSVLSPLAPTYFEVEEGFESHFMEKTAQVRAEFRDRLPAITHVDGSARVQTVVREHNPAYFSLIQAFAELSGLSVVLNTSFNINGEPIVASPDDALNTFYNSGLRHLVVGGFLVQK